MIIFYHAGIERAAAFCSEGDPSDRRMLTIEAEVPPCSSGGAPLEEFETLPLSLKIGEKQ